MATEGVAMGRAVAVRTDYTAGEVRRLEPAMTLQTVIFLNVLLKEYERRVSEKISSTELEEIVGLCEKIIEIGE